MSNPVSYTFRGDVILTAGVTRRQIKQHFKCVAGLWFFGAGILFYEYGFEQSLSSPKNPDPSDLLDQLIRLGWNAGAWEETWQAEPECGEAWSGNTIRGTAEQQLRFPVEERWRAVRTARERRLSRA